MALDIKDKYKYSQQLFFLTSHNKVILFSTVIIELKWNIIKSQTIFLSNDMLLLYFVIFFFIFKCYLFVKFQTNNFVLHNMFPQALKSINTEDSLKYYKYFNSKSPWNKCFK